MTFNLAFAAFVAIAEPALPKLYIAVQPVENALIIEVQSANDASVVQLNAVSTVIIIGNQTILVDPVGEQAQYRQYGSPDIVVLTRAASEYLSTATMIGLLRRDTVVLAPQSVIDELPLMISNNTFAPFEPGNRQTVAGITFQALENMRASPPGTRVIRRSKGDFQVLIDTGSISLSL